MKKLFAYLLSVMCLFIAFACSDGGDESVSPPKPTPNPPVPKDEITLDNSADRDLLFSDKGDSKTITFASTADWQAMLSETRSLDWLSISVKSGGKGKNTLTITVKANEDVEPRTAYLILKINGKTCLVIAIKQMQRDALVVAKESYNVDQKGGEVSIEVGHNVNFTTSINVDWIKQASSRAYQKEKVVFTVAENPTMENREGTVTFVSADGAIKQSVKIYQATKDAIVISPHKQEFDAKEHTFDVCIKANVKYRVELDPKATWLQQIESRGITEETLHFRVEANQDVEPRETVIKVISVQDDITEEVSVLQMQKDALVIANSNYTLKSEGGEVKVKVGHNVDFDVAIDVDWITQKTTRAYVEEELVFAVAENKEEKAREGKITFTSKDGLLKQVVTVKQITEEKLVVGQTEYNFSSKEATFDITVISDIKFGVTDPRVDWIHRVVTRSAYDRTISYKVSANTLGHERTAYIIVADKESKFKTRINLIQSQDNQLVASKKEYILPTEGGTIEIKTVYNVDYDVSHSDWISVVEEKTRAYHFQKFKIDACADGNFREGNITFTAKDKSISQTVKIVQIQKGNIEIPDPEFKSHLIRHYDANKDNELSYYEAYLIKDIDFGYGGGKVKSLKGIEHMPNLRSIDVSYSPLEYIDVTLNSHLEYLSVGPTTLSTINVSHNPKLETLIIQGSESVSTLDVSHNPELETLQLERWDTYGKSKGQLQELDLSANTKLKELELSWQQLKQIDLSHNPALVHLGLQGNQLTAIDLSNALKLETLHLEGNALMEIKLHNLIHLRYVNLEKNKLQLMDISNCQRIDVLYCSFNQLTTLPLDELSNVGHLTCDNNQLTELVFSNHSRLGILSCCNNKLVNLNVNSCVNFRMLDCENNNLSELDLSHNPNQEWLQCVGNPIFTVWVFEGWKSYSNITQGHRVAPKGTEFKVKKDGEGFVRLPDPEFKLYILSRYDTDKDGKLSFKEAEKIEYIEDGRYSQAESRMIFFKSVEGIEAMPNLQELYIGGEEKPKLDLSKNKHLKRLQPGNFSNIKLDLSHNKELVYLDLSGRKDYAEMPDFSMLTNLEEIHLFGNNYKKLDFTTFPKLRKAKVGNNPIEELDISTCKQIENISFQGVETLKTIWVWPGFNPATDMGDSWVPEGVEFKVRGEVEEGNVTIPDDKFRAYLLKNFDLDKNGQLSKEEASKILAIKCASEKVASFKGIEEMPNLSSFVCWGNAISELDLSGNPHLRELDCASNENLTALNLSHNPELRVLCINNLKLEQLNLSHNPELEVLSGYKTTLKTIDISKNTKLKKFELYRGDLTSLDLSHNQAIEEVYCRENEISTLILGSHPRLRTFSAKKNHIPAADFTKCPVLEGIYMSDNSLVSLTLPDTKTLKGVDASGGKLTSIDVSKNIRLENLYLSGNQLTEVDISNNYLLWDFSVRDNKDLETIWVWAGFYEKDVARGNFYKDDYAEYKEREPQAGPTLELSGHAGDVQGNFTDRYIMFIMNNPSHDVIKGRMWIDYTYRINELVGDMTLAEAMDEYEFFPGNANYAMSKLSDEEVNLLNNGQFVKQINSIYSVNTVRLEPNTSYTLILDATNNKGVRTVKRIEVKTSKSKF